MEEATTTLLQGVHHFGELYNKMKGRRFVIK
jgi:hypothetical protein